MEYHGVSDEVDEETMRHEMEQLGISAPDGLTFTCPEEGVACLEADMLRVGDTLYNGSIRRWLNDWGEYYLDYGLVTAQLVREADILIPEKAYERLCRGDFYHGGWIASCGIRTASVTDWKLTYMIDSKGFYQPVYVFTLESEQTEYPYEAFIPAIS